ncbi:MAG TPA: POTRA domain-containing protein [Vicinamibacterales bacterium]|nr:POTRA domain-containing protein [Vicinamibacterales bacterium]
MRTALTLMFIFGVSSGAAAQPVELQSVRQLCACLLEARRIAESQGRLDFSVEIETSEDLAPSDGTVHLRMGSQYVVGRIDFTGHVNINDSTLRRAFTLRERELFDVGKLRRSLARLNDLGLTEPVTLADVVVTRRHDGVTADMTIPLRKRGWRSWSLSGPIVPGLGSYQASISSRLPVWGRGALDASTYLVSLNVLALARPSLGVLSVLSKAPPVVLLERPYLPGQGLLSGFAVSPQLSPWTTVAHYGRTHLGRALHARLDDQSKQTLAVPIVGAGRPEEEFLVCEPEGSRWRWLRRGAVYAIDFALGAAALDGIVK